jgi:hypothetical protein
MGTLELPQEKAFAAMSSAGFERRRDIYFVLHQSRSSRFAKVFASGPG